MSPASSPVLHSFSVFNAQSLLLHSLEELKALTAESIKKVANAISGPGGKEAVKLELGQKYIKSLTKLKSNDNNVIMGGNLADMKEMLKGLDIEI